MPTSERTTQTRFVNLSTGVQDQRTPLCSLTFRGRAHEPGVPLSQFLVEDRARVVCDDPDELFEHDCLDDFMHLRCQVGHRVFYHACETLSARSFQGMQQTADPCSF